MFSGNRSLSSNLCRALFVACVISATTPLTPVAAQTLAPNPCGLTDNLIHLPPTSGAYPYSPPGNWMPGTLGFPGLGQSYVDPVFGCTITRLSNVYPGFGSSRIYDANGYWNADGTRYLQNPDSNVHIDVIDTKTGAVVRGNVPVGSAWGEVSFDPVNPDIYYYFQGASLMQYSVSSGLSSTVATFPATLQSLGESIDYIDRTGRYFSLNVGGSIRVWDKQLNLLYNGSIPATFGGGYAGISPDAHYVIMSPYTSYAIDHVNHTLSTTGTQFWTLSGDHGDVISASDGKTYMITYDTYDLPALFRIDVTIPAGSVAQQKSNNVLLLNATWNDAGAGHISCPAKGDWCFASMEAVDDLATNQGSWWPYKQEILMVQVVPPFAVRRLAHHRSRSLNNSYGDTPRANANWDGTKVMWASNMGDTSYYYSDIYSITVTPSTPDTTPPTVSMTAPSNGATVSGSAVTVSASASDNVGVVGVQFKLDGINSGSEITVAPYNFTLNTTLFSNGAHTLTAVARDAAGNVATSAAANVTVANDTTPPVISSVSASNISSSAATITWATNEASDSQVEYGLTTAYGSATPLNSSLLTAHAMTPTGLLANTPYHYRVKSRDAAGNLATSADFSLTTLVDITPPPAPDTVPPSVPTGPTATAVSSSQINLAWTASTDNVGVAGYQVFRGVVKITTVTATSYSDAGLSAGTTYSYTVAAYDGAGNVSAQSAAATAVTLSPPPPSANPVAAYSYDEGAGTTAADPSVNQNPATLSGAAWSASGKFGSAISFNGTTSYVESPDIDALSPGANATFEAWVSLSAAPSEIASVFNKWSQSIDDEYLFGISPTRQLYLAWQTTGGGAWGTPSYNDASGISAIPLNTLTHIAMVRNGATLSFYINGNLDSSLNNVMDTNAFRNGINTLRIGGQGRGARNRFFNGTIDEVRIYNRALNQAEIQSDMNTAISTVAAYSYNEGSGTTAADASVNKNPATLSGATWNASGKFGSAISFNGTTSYVESPDIDALSPGANATFEAWVSLSAVPSEIASVFNKWSQTIDDEYLFGISPTRQLYLAWQTTGGGAWGTPSFNDASGTGQIPLNTWAHIALVRSGATLNFYINGVLDVSLSVVDTNPFRNGINTLRIGGQGRGGVNRFFNGSIDEVRIYNRALTQAEIQNDMNSPIGVTPPPSDTTPPTVLITVPVSGAIVSGSVTVSANATDNVGVVGVQFKLDGANLGAELMAAPYATSWNPAVSSPGAHTLTAVARDAAGNTATSASVSVTVADMTLPTVSITAPANGATISGTISVSANATDNVGVVGVQFKLDGVNLGAEVLAVPYAVSWATTTAVNGAHTLTAVARDAAGNTATAPAVSVTVGNDTTPPSVSMTAPSAGAAVSGTITVSANATDNVGVVGVQFKLDGVNLGAEVTVAPYTLSWNTTTATNAAHTLTAVARDAAGNSTTSAGISVTVASATVSITAPLNGATLTNLTKVTVKAASGIGLTSILVYSDNILIGTVSCSTTSPCSNTTNTLNWHTNNLAAGPHSLYVVATDTFGNSSSSAPITVFK